MGNKIAKFIGTLLVMVVFLSGTASASLLKFQLQDPLTTIKVGDSFQVKIKADIDDTEGVNPTFAFGFDLSFDGGNTFVLPGDSDSGSVLKFESFTPNGAKGFAYEPFMDDDGDKINGLIGLGNAVRGNGIFLGTFEFTALNTGQATLFLGADDVGSSTSNEGLIPDFLAEKAESIMPNNPTLDVNVVPIPSSLMLLGVGLLGVAGHKRTKK